MNQKLFFIISAIIATAIILSAIFFFEYSESENHSFSITDVREVFEGDAFEIVGYTNDSNEISLFLYNPDGLFVSKDKIFANPNGVFSTIITTGGPLFVEGTYTVIANQTGNVLSHDQTTFVFTKPSG